jgi:RNA polymerase-interacting CarD/CdnL/TRCF family regulator
VYQGEEARDWSRRYKANLEKLGCGDLAEVAEVVVILSFESAKLVSAPGRDAC